MYFDDNVTEVFLKPPLDKISIGSGIGLVRNIWSAIYLNK